MYPSRLANDPSLPSKASGSKTIQVDRARGVSASTFSRTLSTWFRAPGVSWSRASMAMTMARAVSRGTSTSASMALAVARAMPATMSWALFMVLRLA